MIFLLFDLFIDFFFVFFPVSLNTRNKKKFVLKESLRELGIENPKAWFFFRETTKLFLALLGTSLAVGIALTATGLNDTESVFRAIDSIKSQGIFILLYFLLIRVAAEEIFFRGFLTKKIGIFASSIIFAAMHVFYGSIGEVIGAFFLGLMLAKTFMRNKNLVPNIFAHIFYNFFVLIIAYGL